MKITEEIRAQILHAYAVQNRVRDRMERGLQPAKAKDGTLLTLEALKAKALQIAFQIKTDVENKKLQDIVLISLMDGALPFASMLQEALSSLNCPYMYASLQVSSYQGTQSGTLSIQSRLKVSVGECDVLLVDDVVDTGQTVYLLEDHLKNKLGAKSVSIACLIDKQQERMHPVHIRYPGYAMDANAFLVGAGMDFLGLFRDKMTIYCVDPKTLPNLIELKILKSIPQLNQKLQICIQLEQVKNSFTFFSLKKDSVPAKLLKRVEEGIRARL